MRNRNLTVVFLLLPVVTVALAGRVTVSVLGSERGVSKSDVARQGAMQPAGTEIVGLRDAFARHYSNGDGTITAEISGVPVNRLDPQGRWEPLDDTAMELTAVSHTDTSRSLGTVRGASHSGDYRIDNRNSVWSHPWWPFNGDTFKIGGWFRFSTAAIPDSSLVQSVRLSPYAVQRSGGGSGPLFWTSMELDPEAASCEQLWRDVQDGDTYSTYQGSTRARWNFGLGDAAIGDLQARLPDDWFAVGACGGKSTPTDFIQFEGTNQWENACFLQVTYEPPPLVDVAVTRAIITSVPIRIGVPDTFRVRVRNYGTQALTRVPVAVTAAGWQLVATGSVSVAGLDSSEVDLVGMVDLKPGVVHLSFYTYYSNDPNGSNDTVAGVAPVCSSFVTPPLTEEFEGEWGPLGDVPPPSGWVIVGGGTENPPVWNENDWYRDSTSALSGTAAAIHADAPASAAPAETTNDWLVSPRLSCELSAFYQLGYEHDFLPGTGSDTAQVLLSTDDGQTWPTVLHTYTQAASGSVADWIDADIAGQTDVRVAFRYRARPGNGSWRLNSWQLMVAMPQNLDTIVLCSPADCASIPGGIPQFVWRKLCQTSRLLVDDDPGFDSPELCITLSDTAFSPVAPFGTGRYYWKVLGFEGGRLAATAPYRQFDVHTWRAVVSMPVTPSGKQAKDGAWLASDGYSVFAAKGNKASDFYLFDPGDSTWYECASIPNGREAKPPCKGAVGCCGGDASVYATKGNNTQGFWRYDLQKDSWCQLADVPLGTTNKKVKGGTDMAYVELNDTGYVYLLKGYKTEFYRYNTVSGAWQQLPDAPAGTMPKYDKGSFLVYDGGNLLYAHKAKRHELYAFDLATGAWSPALTGMPLIGRTGRSKKAKDGSCGAWFEGAIYALKGGNTQEFWQYVAARDSWTELDTVPAVGATGKKTKVKAGADIAAVDGQLYALKGGKTLEFWTYAPFPSTGSFPQPGRDGVLAERLAAGDWRLAITPNPLTSGFATLSFAQALDHSCTRPLRLSVYNVAGQVLLNRALSVGREASSVILDLRHLSNGVYLVKLSNDDFAGTQKLVLQR